MHASELLRAWRLREDLSQTAAAVGIGVTQPTLSDYETGRKIPRTITAIRIAELTGGAVPVVSWLDEPNPDAAA